MENYKLYTESKERFRSQEETYGFINWEQYFDNFKLECWNMKNPMTGNIEPTIVQFWQNGNGYSIYREGTPIKKEEQPVTTPEFYSDTGVPEFDILNNIYHEIELLKTQRDNTLYGFDGNQLYNEELKDKGCFMDATEVAKLDTRIDAIFSLLKQMESLN